MREKQGMPTEHVQSHLHHNVKLQDCGFIISYLQPFMKASLDNIRSCECVTGCPKVVVKYKCPWVHKNNDPKSAFLSKEIGDVLVNCKYSWKPFVNTTIKSRCKCLLVVCLYVILLCGQQREFIVLWCLMILNSCMVSSPLESLRVVPKIVVATRNRIILYLFIF